MAYITETHGLTASILSRVSDVFGELAKTVADARALQKTFAELDRMSPRELDDLGIDRSQIGQIAREAVYGK